MSATVVKPKSENVHKAVIFPNTGVFKHCLMGIFI